jgi:FkbM family methyltransferase
MKKIFLRVARFLIPLLPKGKSISIVLVLSLFGNKFGGVIHTKDGRKLFIDKISAVKRDLFFLNKFEEYESNVAKKIIGVGDYVVDVGANFGWYTTLASRLVGNSGKVFAFELDPNIAEECRTNVRLNHQEGNVVIVDSGLGEEDGMIDYFYSEKDGMGNLQSEALKKRGGLLKACKGKMTSLDNYLERSGIQKVNFMKCDVDGAEVPFLRGARKTLSSKKPIVLIEVSNWAQEAHGHSCREIFEELSKFDYQFFSLHSGFELKKIENYNGNFKENVLCLPNEKLELLQLL